MLEGVLVFRKLIANTLIGTYIHRVLVIDGYLYSRVYICEKQYLDMPFICHML